MQMDPIRRGGVLLSVRLWRAAKLEVEDGTLQPRVRLPGTVTGEWTQVRDVGGGEREKKKGKGGGGGEEEGGGA